MSAPSVSTINRRRRPNAQKDVIRTQARDWLRDIAFEGHVDTETEIDQLVASLPATYNVFGSMLLLPQHAFTAETWQKVLASVGEPKVSKLWEALGHATKTSRVAINARIPSLVESSTSSTTLQEENILRSPTNLTPLYGNFGPALYDSKPTTQDFEDAFWVSAVQNGITQVWAPRYTMFSRGNIKEKARLLALPSVKSAVALDEGCTAVDLYSGIGYFAFSYAKAGIQKLLCFELNLWSVEGMRRGAKENRWKTQSFDTGGLQSLLDLKEQSWDADARLLIFNVDNIHAKEVVSAIGTNLPPVRHVNCGLLPTSKGSWATAVQILDTTRGGWIHVHENLRLADLNAEVVKIQNEIQRLAGDRDVVVEHVEHVKTYAPGIIHCVLDVFVAAGYR